ncbi:MAG: hypothetical protein WD278_18980, partial [Pirellulales bacterium]
MLHQPMRILLAAVSIGTMGSLLVGPDCVAWGAPAAEELLPGTTAGYVSVPDVPKLIESWKKTQLGQLLDDPVMKPFGDDLRRQIRDKWSQSKSRLGLSLEDVEGLASGELSMAVIHKPEARAAVALLIDVTGNEQRAAEQVEKVADGLLKRGFRRRGQEIGGIEVTVFEQAADAERNYVRRAVYFIKDGLLVASDDVDVVSGILNRWTGEPAESLSVQEPYQAVIERCKRGAEGLEPHVRWFVHPIGLAESVRSWQDDRQRGVPDYLKVLKNQGFTAVQGVGGYMNFAERRYGVLHRTYVFAPPPHELAMRMLSLPNGDDFSPQAWVSRDLATHTTFQLDIQNAFDKFGSLFDEMVEKQGIWVDTLESYKNDPNGPQIDLERDMIAHLGRRVTIVTDYKLPITPTSQRHLVAIKASNADLLAKAIERSMANDPRVKRRSFEKHIVWEIIPEELVVLDVDIEGPGLREDLAVDDAEEQPVGVVLPNSAVTVADGYLLVSSHVDLLEKILQDVAPRERLERDVDYRLVQAELAKLGSGPRCAEGFARTDEQYRATYEMFRLGRLPEMDTVFAQLLNAVLGEDKEGVIRKPQLDASKLPEYEVVRRYLGPAGSFVASEEQGWFVVGFTLSKDMPLANEPKGD